MRLPTKLFLLLPEPCLHYKLQMLATVRICGYALRNGMFSTQIFNVASSGGELFDLLLPVYYLDRNGRLFEMPRGAQSDGISSPRAAQGLRPAGGQDWPAGWFHDGCCRKWMRFWNGEAWENARAQAVTTSEQAADMLYECAEVCGDNELEAETLYWAVTIFGKRNFQP